MTGDAELKNAGKNRAKRFINALAAISAPLRLIGTAMEHVSNSYFSRLIALNFRYLHQN
jgi:hypothetical protein